MPIYDLICKKCGERVDGHLRLNMSVPFPNCEKCGSPMSMRFSPPTIVYKGFGFTKKKLEEITKSPLDYKRATI